MEIWKDIYFEDCGVICDYRGKYQVSNWGRVKSLNYKRTGKEKILKLGIAEGYPQINLRKNGQNNIFKVHRLVAFMFIENDDPEIKIIVVHKDKNKQNNHVSNLEWRNYEYIFDSRTTNKKQYNQESYLYPDINTYPEDVYPDYF